MSSLFNRRDTFSLRVLSFAYFVQVIGALGIIGCLIPISKTWSISESQTSYLVTVFGLVFATLAPLIQIYVGDLQRKRLLISGLSLFALGALICVITDSFSVLIVARVVMAIGATLIGPICIAIASSIAGDKNQGSAIAMVILGLSIASMVGIPLSAFIAETYGPKVYFFSVFTLSLSCLLLVKYVVRDDSHGSRTRFNTIVDSLKNPLHLSSYLVVFFVASAIFTTFAFIGPVIRDYYDGTPNQISLVLMVFGLAGVVGNIFVTFISQKFKSAQILFYSIVILMADWIVTFNLSYSFYILIPGIILWSFITDIIWPSQQRRVIEIDPTIKNVSLALTASFLFTGIGTGSALSGLIYPLYGYQGIGLSSLLLISLALACLVTSMKLQPKGN